MELQAPRDERGEDGREELSLWLDAPVPSRLQNELNIGERKGARAGLPKGAVWRRLIFPAMFSSDVSKQGQARWRRAWLETDERLCIDGPVEIRLDVFRHRPVSHLRVDGTLSTEGLRHPVPDTKPDLSNYVKIAEDALKDLAFGDDGKVVRIEVSKSWVAPHERAGARLRIRAAVVEPRMVPLPI